MNRTTLRALFDDVRAQVLDNLGFRILAVMFLALVLPTWVVGFRDDELVFLFHWHINYEDVFGPDFVSNVQSITGTNSAGAAVRNFVVKMMLDFVADKFGILFAVGAVSFFVPQMLEKGAADTLFSKPLSRLTLLLSRYFAGIAFIAVLVTVLVGGMYFGFLVVSDYDNKGLLWGIVTLTYGFAIFHAISVVVGVFTRSTIAALLLCFIFMPCNCGVHETWKLKTLGEELHERAHQGKAADAPVKPKDEEQSTTSRIGDVLVVLLDTAHYVLPKTGDSTLIADLLRRRIERASMEFTDDESRLSIVASPNGFVREPRSSLNRDDGLLWIAPHPSGAGEGRWTLKKTKAEPGVLRSSIAKAARKQLENDPNVSKLEVSRDIIGGHTADHLEWHEKRGDETRLRRQWIFSGGEYWLTLDYDVELDWSEQATHERDADQFRKGVHFPEENPNRERLEIAYETKFGWHSELKYNAWFSILSTLAFVVAVLALGAWKLSRIDF